MAFSLGVTTVEMRTFMDQMLGKREDDRLLMTSLAGQVHVISQRLIQVEAVVCSIKHVIVPKVAVDDNTQPEQQPLQYTATNLEEVASSVRILSMGLAEVNKNVSQLISQSAVVNDSMANLGSAYNSLDSKVKRMVILSTYADTKLKQEVNLIKADFCKIKVYTKQIGHTQKDISKCIENSQKDTQQERARMAHKTDAMDRKTNLLMKTVKDAEITVIDKITEQSKSVKYQTIIEGQVNREILRSERDSRLPFRSEFTVHNWSKLTSSCGDTIESNSWYIDALDSHVKAKAFFNPFNKSVLLKIVLQNSNALGLWTRTNNKIRLSCRLNVFSERSESWVTLSEGPCNMDDDRVLVCVWVPFSRFEENKSIQNHNDSVVFYYKFY